jgi:integrase
MEQQRRTRELALFNLGIDSKLRGCDLVALKVRDIQHGAQVAPRAIITQRKTGQPVQFEITPPTRAAVQAWIVEAGLKSEDYLFPSRVRRSPHICSRQYQRMLRGWVRDVGLDWTAYGTHMTRSKSPSRWRSEVERSRAGRASRRTCDVCFRESRVVDSQRRQCRDVRAAAVQSVNSTHWECSA